MKMIPIMLGGAILALPVNAKATDAPSTGFEVMVAPTAELSSQSLRTGDLFDIVVTQDSMGPDGQIAIPRGTRGHGRVAWRTGSGPFGKSGKLEFDAVDLQLADRVVPLSGHYRVVGDGRTGITVAVVVLGGVAAGALVRGDQAVADRGTRWSAYATMPLAIPATAVRYAAVQGNDPYEAGRRAGETARLAAGTDD